MTDKVAVIEPEDVFEKLSLEEFVKFSKYGFNYVMFHSNKKMVRKGDIINLDGEFLKINAGIKDIIEPFSDLSVDDLRKGLLNELAKIGIKKGLYMFSFIKYVQLMMVGYKNAFINSLYLTQVYKA